MIMFRHIVVAVDFSPAWEVIARHLAKLRGWGCEQLTLVHVLASHYPLAPAESHRTHYEKRLAESANALRQIGFQAAEMVEAGDPAEVLIEIAKRVNADCLLAGSHGHSTLRGLFIGSTVLNLARLTSRPLLLIPIHAKLVLADTLSRVILGSDCSEAAMGAERFFLDLLETGVQGVAVCAVEHGDPEDQTREQRCAITHIERLGQKYPDLLTSRIEKGTATDVIIQTARDTHAELIIVGKRGHNRLRELLLGSTAEAVCRNAGIPVALIPG
jgi:nucleotide-binding universal stress UspA family protein